MPSTVQRRKGYTRRWCGPRYKAAVLRFVRSSPPAGTVGAPYLYKMEVAGGTGTRVFALTAGTLPSGLTLTTDTGVIVGTPLAAGTSSGISIQVTDASGNATASAISITVA